MGNWLRNRPTATESLASSQGMISNNFTCIESVLGSSTLSLGITKVAGDILYISDSETISRLAKASDANYILSSKDASQNPSWATPEIRTR